MNSRIHSLLNLFECADHFCGEKNRLNIKYFDSVPQIKYDQIKEPFLCMKEKSEEFLCMNLKKAEEKIDKKR